MGESMTRTDLRTYTPEFRAEAVKLVLEQGLSLEVAAQRLSVPKGTLANWVTAAKRGSTASTSAPGSRSVADLEAENARLRRELAVERMEKEVLKKATAYFARESLPGTRN
jgi:transposase